MPLTAEIINKLKGAPESLPIETLLFVLQEGDMSCPFCKHRNQVHFMEGVFVCWRCRTSADAIGLIAHVEGYDLSEEDGQAKAITRYVELAEEHKGNH